LRRPHEQREGEELQEGRAREAVQQRVAAVVAVQLPQARPAPREAHARRARAQQPVAREAAAHVRAADGDVRVQVRQERLGGGKGKGPRWR
jgi:hypothetical protein